jgi:hypothetical protein
VLIQNALTSLKRSSQNFETNILPSLLRKTGLSPEAASTVSKAACGVAGVALGTAGILLIWGATALSLLTGSIIAEHAANLAGLSLVKAFALGIAAPTVGVGLGVSLWHLGDGMGKAAFSSLRNAIDKAFTRTPSKNDAQAPAPAPAPQKSKKSAEERGAELGQQALALIDAQDAKGLHHFLKHNPVDVRIAYNTQAAKPERLDEYAERVGNKEAVVVLRQAGAPEPKNGAG